MKQRLQTFPIIGKYLKSFVPPIIEIDTHLITKYLMIRLILNIPVVSLAIDKVYDNWLML